MFITLDGVDGGGKSTQIKLLVDWLAARGLKVTICRDPGSTPLGERVRDILLHGGPELPIDRRAEMLLYMAARAQLVEQIIRPALAAGEVVVSDRFLLANVVYQAHAGGLDPAEVWQIGAAAIAGISPDCTLLLDVDSATADARMQRAHDRMEQQGADFRRRLRAGFLLEAERDPKRIHVIDANRSVDEVHVAIREIVEPLL